MDLETDILGFRFRNRYPTCGNRNRYPTSGIRNRYSVDWFRNRPDPLIFKTDELI